MVTVERNLHKLPYKALHFRRKNTIPPRPPFLDLAWGSELAVDAKYPDHLLPRPESPLETTEVENLFLPDVTMSDIPPATSIGAPAIAPPLAESQSAGAPQKKKKGRSGKPEVVGEDEFELWVPPCKYCTSIKKECWVRKDRSSRDGKGNVRCLKCVLGKRRSDECDPGREVYNAEGVLVSAPSITQPRSVQPQLGGTDPLPSKPQRSNRKRSRIDSTGDESVKPPARKNKTSAPEDVEDMDDDDVSHYVLGLVESLKGTSGPTVKGLELANDTMRFRLEANAREMRSLIKERELMEDTLTNGEKELAVLKAEERKKERKRIEREKRASRGRGQREVSAERRPSTPAIGKAGPSRIREPPTIAADESEDEVLFLFHGRDDKAGASDGDKGGDDTPSPNSWALQ